MHAWSLHVDLIANSWLYSYDVASYSYDVASYSYDVASYSYDVAGYIAMM